MSQVSGLRTLLRWAFDESPVGWMFSKHESPPISESPQLTALHLASRQGSGRRNLPSSTLIRFIL